MTATLRICSLLPSATEIVFALGLGERLVGVTHECDHPPEAARLPAVTASRAVFRFTANLLSLDGMQSVCRLSDSTGKKNTAIPFP